MVSAYISPLNLGYIFRNTFAGTPLIFFAIFMMGFSILAGTFKMRGGTYLILFGLSSLLLYNWIGGGLLSLVIFIGGLLIFNILSKIVKD